MASEQARKAYPYDQQDYAHTTNRLRDAYDRGAVEALREAAEAITEPHNKHTITGLLTARDRLHALADEREAQNR